MSSHRMIRQASPCYRCGSTALEDLLAWGVKGEGACLVCGGCGRPYVGAMVLIPSPKYMSITVSLDP
jgi:hypothetical protein